MCFYQHQPLHACGNIPISCGSNIHNIYEKKISTNPAVLMQNMDTTPLLPDSRSPTPIKVVDGIVGFLIQDQERSFAEVDNPNVRSGLGGLGIGRGDTVVKLSVTRNPFHASPDAGFQFERSMRIGAPQDQKDGLGLEVGMVGISPSRTILHHNPKIGYESEEAIKDAGSHTSGSR